MISSARSCSVCVPQTSSGVRRARAGADELDLTRLRPDLGRPARADVEQPRPRQLTPRQPLVGPRVIGTPRRQREPPGPARPSGFRAGGQRQAERALLIDHVHGVDRTPAAGDQPAELARARPAMAQAQARAAGDRQRRALGQALRVDRRVEALRAQLAREAAQREQLAAHRSRRIADEPARQAEHAFDGARPLEQRRPAVFAQPGDAMARGGEVGGERQGVDDVAESAEADDQDMHAPRPRHHRRRRHPRPRTPVIAAR